VKATNERNENLTGAGSKGANSVRHGLGLRTRSRSEEPLLLEVRTCFWLRGMCHVGLHRRIGFRLEVSVSNTNTKRLTPSSGFQRDSPARSRASTHLDKTLYLDKVSGL